MMQLTKTVRAPQTFQRPATLAIAGAVLLSALTPAGAARAQTAKAQAAKTQTPGTQTPRAQSYPEVAAALAVPSFKTPRRRDGHPDFQGFWNRWPDLLMSEHLPDQPKPSDPRATPKTQPPPPLKAQYAAILADRHRASGAASDRGQPLAERSVACIPDGMPNVMRAAWIMEILQTPQQINISQELYNQGRRIYMGQKLPPLDDVDPGFFGRSVGHFEGDDLIIETIGIREDVMSSSGAPGSAGGGDTPHSPGEKIVERLRYIGADLIQDQLSIIDPETLEKPWTQVYTYKRMPADYHWQEYVCEGNREAADATGVQRRTDAEEALTGKAK